MPSTAICGAACATATAREKLHFALGKVENDLEHYADAFAHYAAANSLQEARLPPFDAGAHAALQRFCLDRTRRARGTTHRSDDRAAGHPAGEVLQRVE